MTMTVSPGARVLLAFEAGQPDRPVAELWESGTPLTVVVTCASVAITGTLAAGAVAAASMAAPAGADLALDPAPTKKVKLGGGGKAIVLTGDPVSFVGVCPFTGLPHIPGVVTATSTKSEAQ
jgi:hypothetical protein